jgi:ABC-type antimicrobial peptide transport system permease subunit
VLATAGIYGVMAYFVTQRTREIGIRIALGAQWRDVLSLVLKSGMFYVAIGLTIGLAGALALTRLMTSLLFEVSPTDPATFGAVALCVIVATIFACYIPARRATKIDPLVALRYE